MSNRAADLLRLLVERYIAEGQPVSSKVLADLSSLNLSSATIRNVMAELECKGLVMSPHTSAGRIPTTRGYRFFVDSLLRAESLQAVPIARLAQELHADLSTKDLVVATSKKLAEITHMVGIVSMPAKVDSTMLRWVDFLPLTGRRALAILVCNDRDVHNKIISTECEYTEIELHQAANYINASFCGLSLAQIRMEIMRSMAADKARMNAIIRTALELANHSLEGFTDEEGDCALAGEAHLLENGKPKDAGTLRELLAAFSEKRSILNLLDQTMAAQEVQLYIGFESGFAALGDYSVVTAPYAADGMVLGALGVIGAKRMPYERVISIVDAMARLLGSAIHTSGMALQGDRQPGNP